MEKTILHIDFDSFFASVQQQYDVSLRNKPIGVTATNGRTCIIASSREAKKLGITTGTRTYEAYQMCPSLLLIKADFVKYFEVSKKFLNICACYSPYVEMFSIDEVFMDITKTKHLFGGTSAVISKIKSRIFHEIGKYITASVGISHNKLLAKLASGLKKPNGMFEIRAEDVQNVYKTAKLTDICGIGERIRMRLNKIGIYTLIQLQKASLNLLVSEFGNMEGHFLHDVGFGIDTTPIIPYTDFVSVKSVGRNYCLPKNEFNKRIVLQNISELCEEIGIKLRKLKKKAKTVGIRLSGNMAFSGQKSLNAYVDTGDQIFKACLYIAGNNFMHGQTDYIRQISIGVSCLQDKNNIQLSLFDATIKNEKLVQTIDSINRRFGNHTIRNGFLLYADKLTTVPNGYGSDKWERTRLAEDSQLLFS